MSKRRDLIRMTDEEAHAFLHGRRTMNIATYNHDGSIHLVAMWYGFTDDGRVAFETFTKSQKIKNLHRDNRITALVESGDEYSELKGIELVGTAELSDDPAMVMPVARSVVERYFGVEKPEDAEAIAAGLANKRTAVVITPTRTVSWDHSKLGGTY